MTDEVRVEIARESDIVLARQKGRALAAKAGLSSCDQTLIATAISEVARNIVTYAEKGEIYLDILNDHRPPGILIIARDQGPGIPDVGQAMQDGFSTAGSLGLGLPGAKRMMDEFEICSEAGKGTIVKMKKWKR